MSNNTFNHWPQPPQHIAKLWPNGFPADESDKFNEQASKWGRRVAKSISRDIERELSIIDLRDIVQHSRKVLREFFSGSYNLDVLNEIETRYFLGVLGYDPEDVLYELDGSYEEKKAKVREMLHRLHAKAHHE